MPEPSSEAAYPQQYRNLLHLLQESGVNPADLATLCELKYGKPFYNLSRDDATDLLMGIAAQGRSQSRLRSWISDTVSQIQKDWVSGKRDRIG